MNRALLLALLATTAGATALVVTQGTGPDGLATGELGTPLVAWTFPHNDAENVEFTWDGKDIPSPAAPPNGYPSGPVITLQVDGEIALAVQEATVAMEPAGSLVPSTILTHENDAYLKPQSVAVIPEAPLEPGTTYTVEIRGEADGIPFEETWSFTTRTAGCDLLTQDCGAGRGCFLSSLGKQCLWEGKGQVDDPCVHANHCAAGLTCLGTRCVPFCDGREDAADAYLTCTGRCPGGVLNVPGADTAEHARLCVLKNCAKDSSICGEGEACYWLGGFVCAPVGTSKAGTPCSSASDCAPGTSCLGHEGAFMCRTLCGEGDMPACEDACDAPALLFDEENMVSFCP